MVGQFDTAPKTVHPGSFATLRAAERVSGLNFWSWGHGYLDTVTTSLIEDGPVIDSIDTLTGCPISSPRAYGPNLVTSGRR